MHGHPAAGRHGNARHPRAAGTRARPTARGVGPAPCPRRGRGLPLLLASLCALAACGSGGNAPAGPGSPAGSAFWWPYQPSSWGNTHHDPGLSDFTDHDPADRLRTPGERFVELEGATVFTGMSFDDARDRVYVTTGKADPPNLYAFDMAGELAWVPAGGPGEQPDAGAVSGTAIVDTDGNLYLCDTRHAWSYDVRGNLRWQTPLPVEENGQSYPFITPFFTRTGQVGGVTAAGRVLVLDRDTGAEMPGSEGGLRLPGILALPEGPDTSLIGFLMSKLLWNTCDPDNPTMMDPELIAGIGAAFLGVGNPVGNAPAALPDPEDPRTTRIFAAARLEPPSPDAPVSVKLFRVDVTAAEGASGLTVRVHPDFHGLMPDGEGCATSPTLSPDGRAVYVGDNRGVFYAFDSTDGRCLWPQPPVLQGAMLGSPTAARDDGSVYVATDRFLHRIRPDGTVCWARSYDEFARNDAWVPPLHRDGDGVEDFPRRAVPAGLAITSPRRIVLPFTLGYGLSEEAGGMALWPVQAVVALLDRDGLPAAGPYEVPDTVETTACADARGNLYVAHVSSMSSVYSSLYCKLGLDRPGFPLPPPIAPVGGITVLRAGP